MEAISPVFAALGVVDFDALNDLACWLDRRGEPGAASDRNGWPNHAGDPGQPAAGRSAGRGV